jgi:hypothetical protein
LNVCKKGLLVLIVLLLVAVPASAQPGIANLRVDTTPVKDVRELVRQSTLIVVGTTDATYRSYPTSRRVAAGRLVNFVQMVKIERFLKGSGSRTVKLLSTGVQPLPPPPDPINLIYPGPLGEGRYVLFLRALPGTDVKSAVGIWQGVYPLIQGRTIALRGAGFAELHNLTVAELERKLRAAGR